MLRIRLRRQVVVKTHFVQLNPGETTEVRTFVGSMRTYTFPTAEFHGQPRQTVVLGCLRCGMLICGSSMRLARHLLPAGLPAGVF